MINRLFPPLSKARLLVPWPSPSTHPVLLCLLYPRKPPRHPPDAKNVLGITLYLSNPYKIALQTPIVTPICPQTPARISHRTPRIYSHPPQSVVPIAARGSFVGGHSGHATRLFKALNSVPSHLHIPNSLTGPTGPRETWSCPPPLTSSCFPLTRPAPATPPSSRP